MVQGIKSPAGFTDLSCLDFTVYNEIFPSKATCMTHNTSGNEDLVSDFSILCDKTKIA